MSERTEVGNVVAAIGGSLLGVVLIPAAVYGLGRAAEALIVQLQWWRNPIWLLPVLIAFVAGPSIGCFLALRLRQAVRAEQTSLLLLIVWPALGMVVGRVSRDWEAVGRIMLVAMGVVVAAGVCRWGALLNRRANL